MSKEMQEQQKLSYGSCLSPINARLRHFALRRTSTVNCQFLLLPLPIPVHIGHIVGRIIGLSRTYLLDELGGNTTPDFSGGDYCILKNQGTGGHDGAFAYLAVVEKGTTHTDEGMIMNGAGMDGGIMTDGHVTADM